MPFIFNSKSIQFQIRHLFCFLLDLEMNLIRGLRHSPKDGHEYESVEDQKDLRIPVQNEDAFRHGITYKAKVCIMYSKYFYGYPNRSIILNSLFQIFKEKEAN